MPENNPATINDSNEAGLNSGELLHHLFETRAAQCPEAIAVECRSQKLSYAEVNGRANQLARLLREDGIRPNDCVALLLPRSIEVYISILAILKAGAAYVPLDPEYPAERVQFILSDCGARALITTTALSIKAANYPAAIIELDLNQRRLEAFGSQGLKDAGAGSQDVCYVIYTSGTTGQPKGVQIEHRSVCHLVRAEAQIFGVTAADRVFQGFSIAFDASVEEIWLAFFAGATLVVGTHEMVRAGAGLSRLLVEARITVLSCVPTLLAMMEEDVPSMRVLILGGETCPPDLIRRWWKPSRRVVNTYGPTEATVIATFTECHPEKPVTIGRPLPNYEALILDDRTEPVPNGVPGELCLGGIGLARGYLGRPELNREKFVFLDQSRQGKERGDGANWIRRFYRTGDLARWTADGEIEFLGRIDSQVKIRGYRVELGEIESALLECPEVRAVAVVLREDHPGKQLLVAYVVSREPGLFPAKATRDRLRERLPPYMVPAIIECVQELPTLPSGKIDRKRLPIPAWRPGGDEKQVVRPKSDFEQRIASVWERLFAPLPISVVDDFFQDLGGHSLLAARMVSELRKQPELRSVSVLDVYQHPTVASLANALKSRQADRSDPPDSSGRPHQIPFWRHFFCGAAQLLSLVFVLSFFALQWLAPYLTYTILVEEEYDRIQAIAGAFLTLVLLYPVMVCIPILLKWLVIGRYKPGAYPLWGSYYFRWWLVTTVEAAVPIGYMTGTPLLNIYLRLMGAKIGRNVYIGSENMAIYDLLSIGDGSSVNSDARMMGYAVENGFLKLGSIKVGRRCFVGTRSVLRENTSMDDDSALEDLSLLSRDKMIPKGETWLGAPAAAAHGTQGGREGRPNQAGEQRDGGLRRRFFFGILHALGLLLFPVLVVAALFPGIVLMNQLNYIDPYYWYLCLAPLVAVSFLVFLALEIVAIKWLLLGRIKAGRHRLDSFFYLRKWFVDQTLDLSLDVIGPLYASVYLKPWYVLLGARLGNGAEVSTASFISPDLLSVGDDSFIADNVSLGAPRVRDGWRTLGRNHIGKRSFIGNSAVLPPDTSVGERVLIGCLSVPPANPDDALRVDSSWLGSPAIFLPQRQKSQVFADETTFKPTVQLRAMRAAIEFVRVIAPSTGFIILISLLFSQLLLLRDHFSWLRTLIFFPLLYLGCGLAAGVFTIMAKWTLVWRYRPCEKPLWSTFVWRNELLNALQEHLAGPFLVEALTGTPFICWYFRLLGARIGRRVYMETADLSEFDLVQVHDEAELNADCTIQTHLFEDRVMKMSTIDIGSRCVVGAGSLVLYDTQMEKGSSLGAGSLLMKGETLPAGSQWEGIPARSQTQ